MIVECSAPSAVDGARACSGLAGLPGRFEIDALLSPPNESRLCRDWVSIKPRASSTSTTEGSLAASGPRKESAVQAVRSLSSIIGDRVSLKCAPPGQQRSRIFACHQLRVRAKRVL